jgi:PncC family amidohydrolase
MDWPTHTVAGVLGPHVISTDGRSIEAVVGALLMSRGWKIAVAESCTGGLVTSRLTDIPGSSAWVERAVVAYSNEAKIALLGVAESDIAAHGAVSEVVAVAMAEGVRRLAGVEVGVGITGIAGPGGGSEAKPVGTVCLAVAHPGGAVAKTNRYPGERTCVKTFASLGAIDLCAARWPRPAPRATPAGTWEQADESRRGDEMLTDAAAIVAAYASVDPDRGSSCAAWRTRRAAVGSGTSAPPTPCARPRQHRLAGGAGGCGEGRDRHLAGAADACQRRRGRAGGGGLGRRPCRADLAALPRRQGRRHRERRLRRARPGRGRGAIVVFIAVVWSTRSCRSARWRRRWRWSARRRGTSRRSSRKRRRRSPRSSC